MAEVEELILHLHLELMLTVMAGQLKMATVTTMIRRPTPVTRTQRVNGAATVLTTTAMGLLTAESS
jgi:hypothetical protein